MSGRTIAIGDIHGCRQAFEAILAAIVPVPNDKIILLGDFIDRGPDSWGVIARILQLQTECEVISIQGNHEEMLRSASVDQTSLRLWLGFGGDATLESYRLGRDKLPPLTNADIPFRKWLWKLEESRKELYRFPVPHREFICSCVSFYETATHLFVHASCRPNVDAKDESDQFLRWEVVDQRWSKPHQSGKIMVVGHTAQKEGKVLDLGHLLCIDTYCHGGGWLTALDVDSGQCWQANRDGELAQNPAE
ncbi:metallophosphoesterase family protein [soil metagenome]